MLLALALLTSVPQASAVITGAYDQLRVLRSQQTVSRTSSGIIACTESRRAAELLRVTRAACESQARAEVVAANGRPLDILSVTGRVTRAGRLQHHYDGAMEVSDCSVEDFTVECNVDVLVGAAAR